ncbi:prohibitin family protein [bacterium]|jgi:regulator of protease activity HflC (stomatin/prohibitin superfamily)|nr:prohibitin family protein [Paracoccaceae bacterium]MBT3888899.1 prohibitin family protein [Nitrosomonadaceae bacterium]MDB3917157.1 prohibitin family protein [bacterium]
MENINIPKPLIVIAIIVVVFMWFGSSLYQKVPAGYVAVATLFGEVQADPYEEGLHVPVNPFFEWYFYDVRQKSHLEEANVPSQDQLQTKIQVSVQYRIEKDMAPKILKGTGSAKDVLRVHIVPKLRSLLREQGKAIIRAEDFFLEETQQNLQTSLLTGLEDYLVEKGVNVGAVLIRDISLPPFIIKAIESKKEREQEVEKQKAELERFATEQQQKVAQATAESEAATEQANKVRVLADAQAYEIEKINKAIGSNPNYVKLMALEALKAISKDPASKIYFMNGDSPSPLPLMNIGINK